MGEKKQSMDMRRQSQGLKEVRMNFMEKLTLEQNIYGIE